MIVKNEQDTLERCLLSVRDAVDEIIIVDTGSTDNTKQIAYKFTENVFDFVWEDDFAKARNFAFSKGSCEYLMWLDADDVITYDNMEKILKLKNEITQNVSAVYFKYDVDFDKCGNSIFSYFRERIVKKSNNPVWVEPIHEVIKFTGDYIFCDIVVEHRKIHENPKNRNLKIFKNLIKDKKPLSPRLMFYYARELMFNKNYKKAITIFKKFLKCDDAWAVNKMEAYLNLSNCFKLIGDKNNAYLSLFQSFIYNPPNSETLCKIGELFFEDNKIEEAIFWYKNAITLVASNISLGFKKEDYDAFIPYLQLCVAYDKLDNKIEAEKYNELAGKLKPTNSAYLFNKKYFANSKKGEII